MNDRNIAVEPAPILESALRQLLEELLVAQLQAAGRGKEPGYVLLLKTGRSVRVLSGARGKLRVFANLDAVARAVI